jgi:hypothetical protein
MQPSEWIGLMMIVAGILFLLVQRVQSKRARYRSTLHQTLFASHLTTRMFFRGEGWR